MRGWAFVDGVGMPLAEARIPVDDPAVTLGWSVFETLTTRGGVGVRLEAHLDRLAASCRGACLVMPDREDIRREVAALAVRDDVRIRVTITGGGRRIVTAEPVDPARAHQPVRAVRGAHRDEPVLGGEVKHGSRAAWIVAVKRSGVDEVLLVDDAGCFTEATTAAILAVIGGVVWTAPHDGRILESTTCVDVLERAARLGIPVRREGPPAGGGWQGLYVASATRDLAPVIELDGVALPVWDPIGRALTGGAFGRASSRHR